MNRWKSAIVLLGGAAATTAACLFAEPALAGMVFMATVFCAAFTTPIIGNTQVPVNAGISVDEVRRYRLQHSGSTISEAAAAVARR